MEGLLFRVRSKQALNRSRLPLLSDDMLSSTPVDINPNDFDGRNTMSWISDATGSEASHALYREMDPYDYSAMRDSVLSSPSVGDIPEASKVGGWVAITKLSGDRNQTTTTAAFVPNLDDPSMALNRPIIKANGPAVVPVCDEEVDGFELARLARTRAKAASHRNGAMQPNTTLSQCNMPPDSTGVDANGQSTKRPNVLNIRSPALIPTAQSNLKAESPVELAWDHEPGTASVDNPPSSAVLTVDSPEVEPKPSQSTPRATTLYPVRRRRQPRNWVVLPPTQDDSTVLAGHKKASNASSKRWSYSDKLYSTTNSTFSQPPPSTKCTFSPNLFESRTDRAHVESNALFDSGFAGLSSSYVDGDANGNDANRNSDLMWENELIGDGLHHSPTPPAVR